MGDLRAAGADPCVCGGGDEEALEEVCGWLSSEVGLRMTVVDGARELVT